MGQRPIDYFAILGLSAGDLGEDPSGTIRRAYRGLAKRFHPDYHPNDPKAHEQMKRITEAYTTLSDPEKFIPYMRQLQELRLNFGEGFTVSTASEPSHDESYEDLLTGMSFKLPVVGGFNPYERFAVIDLFQALQLFYSGKNVDEINSWINERSGVWKLEEKDGTPQVLIVPQFFLDDHEDTINLRRIISWLPRQEEERDVRPGDFVNIRHFTQPEIYGGLNNVALGEISQDEWSSVIEATEILAMHQAGVLISAPFQYMARNVFLKLAREHAYDGTSFDEITLQRQLTTSEGQMLSLEAPRPKE